MTNFFTPASSHLAIPRAPLRIAQQATAPANDSVTEATYAYFPLTIASVGDCYTSRNSTWSGTLQHRIWANRYNAGHNQKNNPTQPVIKNTSNAQCWISYTTIAKANAATATRLSYSAGYAEHEADTVSGWGDIRDAAGLTDVTWDYANTNANTVFSSPGHASDGPCCVDVIVLPRTRLCDCTTGGKDFSLDYEPQDSRSTSDTAAIVAQCVALAHGKGYALTFYTNPLDGSGGTPYNGLLAIVDSVLASCDYFNLLLYSGSGNVLTSFNAQVAKFTNPDFTKLQMTWGLDCTASDAATIRDQMRLAGFAGVEFWPSGATIGGDCSTNSSVINQIATLIGVAGC